MRSRPDPGLLPLLALCALLGAASPAGAVGGDPPTQAEVDRAVEAVKKDPNLAAEKSVRTLQWKDSGDDDKPEKEPARRKSHWPAWLDWLPNLFGWIGQASQMLVERPRLHRVRRELGAVDFILAHLRQHIGARRNVRGEEDEQLGLGLAVG